MCLGLMVLGIFCIKQVELTKITSPVQPRSGLWRAALPIRKAEAALGPVSVEQATRKMHLWKPTGDLY